METLLTRALYLAPVFGTIVGGYVLLARPDRQKSWTWPNSTVPVALNGLFPAGKRSTNGSMKAIEAFGAPPQVPWANDSGLYVQRHAIKCRGPEYNCAAQGTKGQAYVVTLPRITSGSSVWTTQPAAWYLSTIEHFQTGWHQEYPVATVLQVPSDTPSTVEYILESWDAPTGGIRPMINADDTPFAPSESSPTARNVTGDWAHSFVIVNNANHTIYVGSTTVSSAGSSEPLTYYALAPGAKALFWPRDRFWASAGQSGVPVATHWMAAQLPDEAPIELCAATAEYMMYNVLAPLAPLASSS